MASVIAILIGYQGAAAVLYHYGYGYFDEQI